MKKMIFVLSVGIISMAGSAHALTAMEDAIARKACGGGPILDADYRADGKLEVRCPVGTEVATGAAGAGVLGGTSLSGGAVAGMVIVVGVLAAGSGGSGGNTTTTTTTGTN